MSASWFVNVAGRTYGPYTDGQMASFAAEGRLAPQSMISRADDPTIRMAVEEQSLAHLFPLQVEPQPEPAPVQPAPRVEARPTGGFGRSRDDAQKSGERSHVLVVADMKSRSINGLEEEIYKLGQACPILPQVWLLRTDQSINTVRNLLVQQLGKLDALFVVDATNNKAAWFNFGPEADARIRRLWSRDHDDAALALQTG